ncbi:FkbM family methyltransferase [Candidatus Leptofilum sp.]|uniref:FkbM family methyltransferase n=1 Tax=Candidatus Leptofilum sp. TaxID=3241576 RepID=UPI003B5B553E
MKQDYPLFISFVQQLVKPHLQKMQNSLANLFSGKSGGMSITDLSLQLYRKTIKRFHSAHVATHWLMTHGAIPFLEKTRNFRTMPDDPFWFRLELLTNRHEVETIALLDQLAAPGLTMLDIGAHVGYYSHRYAKVLGENGRIFAFEPHPRTFATLQHNVEHLPQVTAVNLALAEQEGTAELHDYLMMSASGSLHYDESMAALQKAQTHETDIAPRIAQRFDAQTFTVRTMPVDDFLAAQKVEQVDLVKMDIEGAEIGALRGMQRTIANSPNLKLVMEYNPQALTAFGHNPVAALREVQSFGFAQVEAIEQDGRLTNLTHQPDHLRALTEQLMQNMGVINLLLQK